MSSVRKAQTPRRALFRIGRRPDPLAWPPWQYVGDGRFDDPQHEFPVLYASARRRTAFIETLARFRLSLDVLTALQAVDNSDELLPTARVPADWYQTRAVGRLRVPAGQRWLDLRSIETRETLRGELAITLLDLRLGDLDLSEVIGPRRQLTQAVARWAYDRRYAGIAYNSRFGADLTCWAIFENALFEYVGAPEPILPDDPDLRGVADLFGLTV